MRVSELPLVRLSAVPHLHNLAGPKSFSQPAKCSTCGNGLLCRTCGPILCGTAQALGSDAASARQLQHKIRGRVHLNEMIGR